MFNGFIKGQACVWRTVKSGREREMSDSILRVNFF